LTIALGIDTGGTYTDAVIVNSQTGEVLSSAKSLTTRRDLSIGVKKAILAALETGPKDNLSLVALSTTLATNAITEGHGAPVCLLLIGYDRKLIQQYRFQRELATKDVVYISGGHDIKGNEVAPLDEKAARQAIQQRIERVSAFAVSGYFGAYNPTHELKVRKLINTFTDLPVTCGHELSTRLNSIRRATTVALNARLIPIIQDLIANVRSVLQELAVKAPLMVVKGDGSLVRAEWATQRPIETVLSGPAASAMGAFQLAGKKDVWAVDVGGTTTDIVELKQGRPKLNPDGANIGGWRTMVEAVDVHTIGLGGDSHIRCDDEKQIHIGPKRVVPLCKLVSEYPGVLSELRRLSEVRSFYPGVDQFLIIGKKNNTRISDKDAAVLNLLQSKPQSLAMLVSKVIRDDPWLTKRLQIMEEAGTVQRAGFTPTDALHVLNRFQLWDTRASEVGAQLLAGRLALSTTEFCEKVVQRVSTQLAASVVTKVIEEKIGPPNWDGEPTAKALLEWALNDNQTAQLGCRMTLERPIVALGAPVEAYMPQSADKLHTQLFIPEHAEVANAIGAASGGVIQRILVHIRPLEGGSPLRLHLPEGLKDFSDLQEAVDYANAHMVPRIEAQAQRAGAKQAEVKMNRVDKRAKVRGQEDIYLGTELTFVAFGRPSIARST